MDAEPGLHSASDSEDLEMTISQPSKNMSTSTSHDLEFFISYYPTISKRLEDKAYGVHSGVSDQFSSAARDATMDLMQDGGAQKATESKSKRWDKQHKKYVSQANDHDGSRDARLI
ncbi:MAG: ATP-dependent RNA helicase dbp10 [Alectoria fallacina]|uniref:ATP-dependent RNA helicase dbp10 n=1 Tax=Alectoria fallacina TaxID=1903189 RepID=A0A8H3FXW7_9LECA|nr:MAG: ATP-dependent RNA helicase dbp10 [Alectoria fallacina]